MLKFLSPLAAFAVVALASFTDARAAVAAPSTPATALWTGSVAGAPFEHRVRGDQVLSTQFVVVSGDDYTFQVEIVSIAGGYLVTISDVDDGPQRRPAMDADDHHGRTWRFIEDLADGVERTLQLHAPGGGLVSQITLRKSR